MKFHPEDKKIKEILSGSRTYTIPNFQRDYSWENKNFEHFIDDLLSVSGAKFENNELSIFEQEKMEDYFFGTFLVVGDYSKEKESKKVIDGQQRLTTMTLFLSAIRDIIEELKQEHEIHYEHTIEEAILSRSYVNGKSIETARVINEKLEPILPVNILNINGHRDLGNNHEAKNESQNFILEKYRWFKDELCPYSIAQRLKSDKLTKVEKEYLSNIDKYKYINFLDNLSYQLLNSTVIIIYSEDEQSANIMYRNFNYRGLPLSGADLIKNEIFELLDDDTGSVKSTWQEIENNVTKDENSSLITFFMHYFSSKYKNISKNEIFSLFTEKIDSTTSSYSKFMQELKRESLHYKSIINPQDEDTLFGIVYYFMKNNNPFIKRQLQLINDLDVIQLRTLLLGLYYARDNNLISSKQFKYVIEKVILYQSLFIIGSVNANTLRNIYFRYGREFRKTQKIKSNALIKQLFNDLGKILPKEEDVISYNELVYSTSKKYDEMSKKDKKNRRLILLILRTLAKKIQETSGNIDKNDAFKFIDDASIEHIIDQNTNYENRFLLGNLLLLEQELHNENYSKEEAYFESKILMTKYFKDDLNSFNKDECILERNTELLKEYYEYVVQM